MAGKNFDITKFAATLPPEGVPESGTTLEIAVDDIVDNPRNFYPRPDNAALAELMESIRANGLLEPPTVVAAGEGKYRLISGHSRLAAIRSMWDMPLQLNSVQSKMAAERSGLLEPVRLIRDFSP